MTSVWLVMLIFGKVAGAVGPLPFDLAACERHKPDKVIEIDQKFEADRDAGGPGMIIAGHKVERQDVTIECRQQDGRPASEINPR